MNLRTSHSPPSAAGLDFLERKEFSIADYIVQSHSALENQRLCFERERAAFSEERKLWDQERSLLRSEIVDLKQQLYKVTGSMAMATSTARSGGKPHDGLRVWEKPNVMPNPTRIFLDGIAESPSHPSNCDPLAPGSSPSLDDALSPRTKPADRSDPVRIPVEMLDSTLDGITLKSTGLPPDFAAKLSSPSPSTLSSPLQPPITNHRTPTGLLHPEISPHDEYFTLNAGHTPASKNDNRVPGDEPSRKASVVIVEKSSDNQQLCPPPPLAENTQNEEYDLDVVDLDDDPALKGPLGLQNDDLPDMEFLEELDQKLNQEAQRASSHPSLYNTEPLSETTDIDPGSEPEIRFKKSTNFGTAFGSTQRRNYLG